MTDYRASYQKTAVFIVTMTRLSDLIVMKMYDLETAEGERKSPLFLVYGHKGCKPKASVLAAWNANRI
jgi:hypothetical protein